MKHSGLRIGKKDGFRNDQTMIIWMIKPSKWDFYMWEKNNKTPKEICQM